MMLFGSQEVTRVYTRIAYEINLLNTLMALLIQRKQTKLLFIEGYPVLSPNSVLNTT